VEEEMDKEEAEERAEERAEEYKILILEINNST